MAYMALVAYVRAWRSYARAAVVETCARFASMHPATSVSVSPSPSFVAARGLSVRARRAKKGVPQQNLRATTAVVYIASVLIPPGIVSLDFDLLCHAAWAASLSRAHRITTGIRLG